MHRGYIRVWRKIFDHKFWNENRELSRFEAWFWILSEARFDERETQQYIGNKVVRWGYAQIPASIRFLSEAWNWTPKKVRVFLSELKNDKSITIDNSQGINVITLCKFQLYNQEVSQGTMKGTEEVIDNYLDNNNLEDSEAWQGHSKGHSKGTVRAQQGHKTKNYNNRNNLNNNTCENEFSRAEEEIERPKIEKKKKAAPKEPLHSELKNFFLDYYLKIKNVEYYFVGKDGKALNSIIAKIRSMSPEKNDEIIIASFKKLISSIRQGDWLYDNFSLSKIDSQFNELVAKIRKSGNGNTAGNYDNMKNRIYERVKKGYDK